MSEDLKFVAYEGGNVQVLASDSSSREAVLALPLNRLLIKMVRVPLEADPVEFSTPILKSLTPFPDEPLTVSCELVREDSGGKVMIAAAFPETAADDVAEAMDAQKLSIVKIDSLALGMIRGVWNSLKVEAGRKLVLMRSDDCYSLVVLDKDQPVAIRAITNIADLKREVMLSLLEAEDFGGAKKLDEIVLVETDKNDAGDESDQASADPLAALADFAPLRRITVGSDAALVGVANRANDDSTINALPDGWREVLEETRFKFKLIKYLSIAGGIWLLIMAVMFGVPMVYDFMTSHQKSLSKQHARQYQAVKEMKAKVDLVSKYSDHSRGALEIMKAVSDRLPEGITLTSWYYNRDEGVRVSGEADDRDPVYEFKDAMDEMADGEDGEGEKIFGTVDLSNISGSNKGFRFNLDCRYAAEEE